MTGAEGDAALLRAAGLILPPLQAPIGNFLPAVEAGGFLHVSGQAPLGPDGQALFGKADEVGLDEARRRAGLVALALLASVATEPGRLARVDRVVRLFGMVNAGPDFTGAHLVIDGACEMLRRLYPEPPACSAVVMPSLPGDITVEIEAVMALR